MFADAAAGGAENAKGMCFVNKQPGLMAVLDLHDARQIRDIAVHTVEGLYDNQHVAVVLAVICEEFVEMIQIVMAEDDDFRARTLGRADNAVVRELVDEKRIPPS